MNLGLLCGSLNDSSANVAALDLVSVWAGGKQVSSVSIRGLGQIPPFVASLVDEPPASVASLVGAHEGTAANRLARLTEAVSGYGIDPARFGEMG